MEISDLCCKNSIWKGNLGNFDYCSIDKEGNRYDVGAVVIHNQQPYLVNRIHYTKSMDVTPVPSVPSKMPSSEAAHLSNEIVNLYSEMPLTSKQYNESLGKTFYQSELEKSFLGLNLEKIEFSGNPVLTDNLQGVLRYSFGNQDFPWKHFVSWKAKRDLEKFKVTPLNSNAFHNSKYINEFIHLSISEGVDQIVTKISQDLPF